VKEQQQVIEEKEAKIQELENRLERLEKLMTGASGTFHKQSNRAVLEQNAPNGFSNKTSIKYFIPESVKTAEIHIYTVNGTKVNSYPIYERGAGELVISADEYKSGLHLYDLVTDGKSVGAKKMLVE
jgi:restriction endonuclease S subunit